ncbi:acyl-CoA synthetase [Mycolicibacterium celeriflavum]|uniref:AMP-binding protein n=1 Tax=Mycolicibacterium celeriflavum TaxID=1249101 RepID=UPI0007FCF46B|nr:AMP-binding protein [Mycolicibacterium celeriflavum]OBG23964.1 acyl-CoA synthetase [Mycolicibacterium celeriflavum]
MNESSPAAILRERAGFQPDDTAFTFIDYDQDWNGVPETLTWSQLYRRTTNVAHALKGCASPGDRAVISAPQGLDYIVAFYGALQAGLIAVPLSVPMGGVTDERVDSVLHDSSPTVVLTTSAVVDSVTASVQSQGGPSTPAVIAVDSLDLEAPPVSDTGIEEGPDIAYLQYTSGSTRTPAGVMVSNRNLVINFGQLMADLFADDGNVPPPDTTIVSWLPFYHDMGLMVGIFVPVLAGLHAVLISPMAFLQRPARWMQLLASNRHAFSSAPNFAFEIAAKKTSDEDMAGLGLGEVRGIGSGSERINPATIKRFTERFARFNLRDTVLRPGYGLAEATVYVVTGRPNQIPKVVRFDSDKLTAGKAERCQNGGGTPLVSYGVPHSPTVRIVDPDTRTECPAGVTGEIWVHGENVALGYWQKPDETAATFGAKIVAPSDGTPEGPWLRTGDQGFFFDDEVFVIGRIKDLLIVYGRNHSPDDIEATVQEITAGRCAAIAVPDRQTEKLVLIIEAKKRGDSEQEASEKLAEVKREVTSAISNSHGLNVADLVLVPPGSIPITTSGKVRRATCVEQYRQSQFARIDA